MTAILLTNTTVGFLQERDSFLIRWVIPGLLSLLRIVSISSQKNSLMKLWAWKKISPKKFVKQDPRRCWITPALKLIFGKNPWYKSLGRGVSVSRWVLSRRLSKRIRTAELDLKTNCKKVQSRAPLVFEKKSSWEIYLIRSHLADRGRVGGFGGGVGIRRASNQCQALRYIRHLVIFNLSLNYIFWAINSEGPLKSPFLISRFFDH